MFGYLRPLQGELKVRELEHFKACYCGLCHAIGRKYGVAARFTISYELVFLAMLLWPPEVPVRIERRRCIASPCRSRHCCAGNDALEISAGYNVILTWWKLRDAVEDESFFRALPYKAISCVIRSAYKKAARDYQGFDSAVKYEVKSLFEHEAKGLQSLDEAADKFASMLKAAAPEGMPPAIRRPLVELLFHLGRWIYIIDAYDDCMDDVKVGRFNPVSARFKWETGKLNSDDVKRLETTLEHSNNLLCSAFELLPSTVWTDTVRNIIYLGMPDTCRRVLNGEWPPRKKK